MALPPLHGGPWLDLLIKDPLTYVRHALRGNSASNEDFARCTPDRPPVLLIHGFLGTRGALYVLERRLRADGFHVFSIDLGSLNTQDIRKSAFEIHLAVERIMEATEGRVRRIDVVGHSMGGLIASYYIKFMDGDEHVRKLVTLGTPYHGTWASLMGVACLGAIASSIWQMLPGSEFLRTLNAQAMPSVVEWTSVCARYDGLCPPETTWISPGCNYELPLGHAGLVLSADVYRIVKKVLRRDPQRAWRTLHFRLVDGKWQRAAPAKATADRRSPESVDRRQGERRRANGRDTRRGAKK